MKCWFYVPGIYIFLLSLHNLIDRTNTLWRTVNFPKYYVLLHAHFFDYRFVLSIKWQFAVILSILRWKEKEKVIFSCNFLCPILSLYCTSHMLCTVELLSWVRDISLFLQHGCKAHSSVSSSARLLPSAQPVTWKNVDCMHRMKP